MSPSTLTVRGALRGRHLPVNDRPDNKVLALNKKAKTAAAIARHLAMQILGKVGLRWDSIRATHLTGQRLLAYMEAAKLTKPHGFVPGQDMTYKHLHPTKGYRFVPA
jgi:hypothetical protein